MRRVYYFLFVLIAITSPVGAAADNSVQSDFNFIELTIEKTHRAFYEKKITCEQLVRRYIKRIRTYDQSTKLNAITYINPDAIERARKLDILFKQDKPGKLHCVPVVLKDNIGTSDMPTEAGSTAMRGFRPPQDADVVKKLRAAGAVILAKSNMDEWAFSPYHTISSTHGETRNAYNREYAPGGSSGGTASAIAANFALVGLGTDTGSSVRGPAAHLALTGFRPTFGIISKKGVIPLLANRDTVGLMARTVEDTRRLFEVLEDKKSNIKLIQSVKGKRDLRGARLGVLHQLFDTPDSDFEIVEIMDRAIAELKNAGAVIVDPFLIKDFDKKRRAVNFCSRFYWDLNNYLQRMKPAPIVSLDDVVKHKRYLAHNQGFIDWAMEKKGNPSEQFPPCTSINDDPRRKELLDAVLMAMDKFSIDAIIYPTWSNPPGEVGDMERPVGDNSSKIAPHTGQPALTVPMGFTELGLPVGLEFLGRPFDDDRLFGYASDFEARTRYRKPPNEYGVIER